MPEWVRGTIRRQTVVCVAVLLLVGALAGQLVRVAGLYSANWDEAHHLYDGYLILTRGDFRANAEVPPLVKMAAALPLLRLHPVLPEEMAASHTTNAFLNGRLFVFGNGGDRLLFPARLMCVGFSVLLAVLVFAAGRRMFGVGAGLAALMLFAFDPNMVAHGSLISTDVGSACFLFASVYAFYRYAERRAWPWMVATGVCAGLALVTKFTGILVAPMLLGLALAEGLRARRWVVAGRFVAAAVAALLLGWAVIWAFYGFRYAPAGAGAELVPALGPYLASMPEPREGVWLAAVARWHLLPEAYVWGLANTKHTEWEYTSYFLGRVYRHGPWEYFPVAFLVKSTLPLLLLLGLAPVVWWRAGRRYGRELVFLLLPVGVYGAVVVGSHFDIGARHLMPVYPFLYVLAGAVVAMLWRRGRGWAVLAVGLLVWQVVTTVRVSPSYMAYGNEAVGGPLGVRRFLSDSNVDWGQQLKTVRQYLAENRVNDCWFGYFPDGAVQPGDYGVRCKRLPTPSGLWWLNLPMQVPPVIDGTVLLSESVLDGVESGDGTLNPYDGFRGLKPVAVLQDGVYVYRGRFAVPLAAAWVNVKRAGERSAAGDLPGALGLAEEAVRLAPESAQTQLELATVLEGMGRRGEAAVHYRLAAAAVRAWRPELQGEAEASIEAGLRRVGG